MTRSAEGSGSVNRPSEMTSWVPSGSAVSRSWPDAGEVALPGRWATDGPARALWRGEPLRPYRPHRELTACLRRVGPDFLQRRHHAGDVSVVRLPASGQAGQREHQTCSRPRPPRPAAMLVNGRSAPPASSAAWSATGPPTRVPCCRPGPADPTRRIRSCRSASHAGQAPDKPHHAAPGRASA